MMRADETLKRYFLEELDYLREESVRFAGDFPEVAHELSLNREKATDPQVEMMLQSFAYLTGKLRYQMDLDDALLPNQLLAALCPHLEAPWPAASVVQFDVPKGGQRIARDTPLSAEINLRGEHQPCRFITRLDTDAWPLKVSDVAMTPLTRLADIPLNWQQRDTQSVLRLTIESTDQQPISALALNELTFYLNGSDRFRLHELLCGHLTGVLLADPDSGTQQMLSADQLSFGGLHSDEALLPGEVSVNPGLPLLREYFLFPDKFLFGTLKGLSDFVVGETLELYFLLNRPCAAPHHDSFQLNCAPVINLFRQAIEPIPLRAGRLEYTATGDQFRHAQVEVHSLIELNCLQPDGKVQPLQPLYGERNSDFGYWVARREPSQLPSVPGTELHLRFLDQAYQPDWAPGASVIGRAWCTNRMLPDQLPLDQPLQLDRPGAVQQARLLKRPSRHSSPALTGDQSRRLVAQLNSYYLPMSNDEGGLDSLRQLLSQHALEQQPDAMRQLNGLLQLRCRMIGHRVGKDAWKGYCHGTEMELRIDPTQFDRTSVMLFGQVLSECLAHFVPLNSFVQLKLCDGDGELIHKWPARTGQQCLL